LSVRVGGKKRCAAKEGKSCYNQESKSCSGDDRRISTGVVRLMTSGQPQCLTANHKPGTNSQARDSSAVFGSERVTCGVAFWTPA
jgi:hypothetical protein